MAKSRMKMSRADRAKQFLAFDAVKGLRDAVENKEKIVVPKMELSDEMKEELDWKLHQIRLQDILTIVYFMNGEYIKVTGMVSYIDKDSRLMKIVSTKIPFDDISDIQGDRFRE